MNIPDEAIQKAEQAWDATCDKGLAGPGYENAWREAISAALEVIMAPSAIAQAWDEGRLAGNQPLRQPNPYGSEAK